jgi:stage V sporulation protein R
MELIDQHSKKIMEGCKERARDAGLTFRDESLEYIVTNRDLIELSPKGMIPTLYDYWVHDVEVLKEKGKYELYPGNPYETVINTRPAISYYNDNNPDWLNVMIFYHVIGHIDFFQNNLYFRHTWDYDFTGEALSDKRMIAKFRSEHGRWVDYIIEFSRGVDNLVGYFDELSHLYKQSKAFRQNKLDYYFDVFLQTEKKVHITEYIKEIERYNKCIRDYGKLGEQDFFSEVDLKYPEFQSLYKKSLEEKPKKKIDLMRYLMENSPFLNKESNKWMKAVMQVVRKTSIFFQPQIRTKVMNEGWASYWHDMLFLRDDRIKGHEVDYARVNAKVTSLPRVGLNPYALGMRLFQYIEELGDKGKYSYDFQKIQDEYQRKNFNMETGNGNKLIFKVRENFADFSFINTFLDQEFMKLHKLFVAGRRLNQQRGVWEYFVQSRKLKDYKKMLIDSLYHPPHVEINTEKGKDTYLYLDHKFEGKPLVTEYIANTLLGIEYLWGGPVQLETSEVTAVGLRPQKPILPSLTPYRPPVEETKPEIKWQRVVYTMEKRKLSKKVI